MKRIGMTRALSLLLCLVLCLSMVPAAYAAQGEEPADGHAEEVPAEDDTAGVPEAPAEEPAEEEPAEDEDLGTPEEPTEAPSEEPAEEPAEEVPVEAADLGAPVVPAEEPAEEAPAEEAPAEEAPAEDNALGGSEEPTEAPAEETLGTDQTSEEPIQSVTAEDAPAAEGVTIDETAFPDLIFRSWVLTYTDTDRDGALSPQEAAAVTSISLPSKKVGNLTGLGYFTALTELDCSNNQLTTLDVSGNPALVSLNCSKNQLEELNVSGNHMLNALTCSYNQLTELEIVSAPDLTTLNCMSNRLDALDLSGCPALVGLNCSNNQLTALDVSGNPALVNLTCGSNQITALDASPCLKLEKLNCSYNRMETLSVSGCSALTSLTCSSNRLTGLDVSGCPKLETLDCRSNRLTALDVSVCPVLTKLVCEENRLTTLDLSANAGLNLGSCTCGNQRFSYAQMEGAGTENRLDMAAVVGTDKVGRILAITDPTDGYAFENGIFTTTRALHSLTYTYDHGLPSADPMTVTVNLKLGVPGLTGVEVNETNFPDDAFRACVAQDADWNKDGVLDEWEIPGFCDRGEIVDGYLGSSLDLSGMGIADLKGIEFFADVQKLVCRDNALTSLDLSALSRLIELDCSHNQLTELKLPHCPKELDCSYNQLTTLELPSSGYIVEFVNCSYNQLTELTVKASVDDLNCSHNHLTGLNYYSFGDYSGQTIAAVMLRTPEGYTLDFAALVGADNVSYVRISDPADGYTFENGLFTTASALTRLVYLYDRELEYGSGCMDVTVDLTISEVPVTGVELDRTSLTMAVGETARLTAAVSPGNASRPGVAWSSSDETVATVNQDGIVTARGEGTATVTAATEDGGYTARCTVKVNRFVLAITSVSNTAKGVQLSWGAVPGAAKYAVYRKAAGESKYARYTVTAATAYLDKNVTDGTFYYYRIWSLNAAGKTMGEWSNARGITCVHNPTPTLTSIANTANGVKLTWGAVTGVAKYAIYRKSAAESKYTRISVTAAAAYTDRSAADGTYYYYRIWSMNSSSAVLGEWSGAKAITCNRSVTPIISSITNTTEGVTLRWGALSTVAKYAVYRKTMGESKYIRYTITTTPVYTDRNGVDGTYYYYRIMSLDANGKTLGTWSNARGITYLKIAKPVITSVANGSNGVKVTWGAVSGAAKYAVYRMAEGESRYTRLSVTAATSYTDRGAVDGVCYYYRIYCSDANGKVYGEYSDSRSITCSRTN